MKDPASGDWQDHAANAQPKAAFAWAESGRASAWQIAKGVDGRFHLYAPILRRRGGGEMHLFAVGVAGADMPR